MDTIARDTRTEFDLARTGPGTPMGRFMRRFWMPIMRSEDLPKGYANPIRIMSEDFALYRGESGQAQVIDYRCPHRGAQMHLGWVEGDDIRCVYHGWKFEYGGQCIEQPAEEPGFARKVRIGSYPTREHLGLVFAYFGEGAPPPFPPYPAPQAEGFIENQTQFVPCNCLQCFENSMDEVHVAFVHRIGGTGAAKDSYRRTRAQYYAKRADAGPAEELARAVMGGRVRFQEIDHPDRVRVQDIAVQAGQGPIADRSNERLGRSDLAIILWRKILERELRAMEEDRPLKEWTPAPADIVPTLGF